MIKYWCDVPDSIKDFQFSELEIKEVPLDESRIFVTKYHYSGKLGNSSIKYGVYLNDVLLAICIFGAITRKESATRLGYKYNEILELTRFCIHPQYQKRNLASWFISRCIKKLKSEYKQYKCLISFADTTFNHNGGIYKASNWEFDGEVNPSYWYVDKDGSRIHKKTLWNQARDYHTTEVEFAKMFKYTKVPGKKKYRYLYKLS